MNQFDDTPSMGGMNDYLDALSRQVDQASQLPQYAAPQPYSFGDWAGDKLIPNYWDWTRPDEQDYLQKSSLNWPEPVHPASWQGIGSFLQQLIPTNPLPQGLQSGHSPSYYWDLMKKGEWDLGKILKGNFPKDTTIYQGSYPE